MSASKSQDFAAWYTQVRRIFGLPTPSASEVSESDQQNVSRVTLEGGLMVNDPSKMPVPLKK